MLTRSRIVTGAWRIGFLTVFLMAARPSAQDPAPLFEKGATLDARLVDAGGPAVVRAREAVVRFDRLTSAAATLSAGGRRPVLTINLFDDVVLAAEFERLESEGFGHQTWVGHVAGDPLGTVTLTWKGSVLSGVVSAGDALYRISAPVGTATIEQLDPGSFP
jgi:hypothetical protein